MPIKRINRKPPGPTARARKRKADRDKRYAAKIRADVAERDGLCRLGEWENNPDDWHSDAVNDVCDGGSQWAHFGEKKRFKTRGLPPEERHTMAGSLMLCEKHHDDYDEGRLVITAQTSLDCNGPLNFEPARSPHEA